jgi:capsular exopolysaccharide synthesis family protein
MITIDEPRSPVSEAFRSLRTNFQFTSVDKPMRSLLITSAGIGEGKTLVAANLSVVLAQGGSQVTLVDTDLRRPRIHRQLKIPNRRGLTSLFMRPDINLDGALQEAGVNGLSAITSGNLPPNPAELLGSERMRNILEKICQQSHVVVFDSPPVIAVTDAVILSQVVDGVLLVVQPGKSKIAALQKTVEQLKRVGANIIGVVLNNVRHNAARYSYYYYYYSDDYYGYQKKGRRRKQKA